VIAGSVGRSSIATARVSDHDGRPVIEALPFTSKRLQPPLYQREKLFWRAFGKVESKLGDEVNCRWARFAQVEPGHGKRVGLSCAQTEGRQEGNGTFGPAQIGEVETGIFDDGFAASNESCLVVDQLDVRTLVHEAPESVGDAKFVLDYQMAQVMGKVVPVARKLPSGRRAVTSGDVYVVTMPSVAHKRDLQDHAPLSRDNRTAPYRRERVSRSPTGPWAMPEVHA